MPTILAVQPTLIGTAGAGAGGRHYQTVLDVWLTIRTWYTDNKKGNTNNTGAATATKTRWCHK